MEVQRQSAKKCLGELQEHLLDIGNVISGGTRPIRVIEAPRQSGSDEEESDLLQGLVCRSDLGHYVAAISGVGQHLLDPPDLAFNATESFLQVVEGLLGQLHDTFWLWLSAHRCMVAPTVSTRTTGVRAGLWVTFSVEVNRGSDDLLEHAEIDVGDLLHVEAALASFDVTELCNRVPVLLIGRADVQRDRCFS